MGVWVFLGFLGGFLIVVGISLRWRRITDLNGEVARMAYEVGDSGSRRLAEWCILLACIVVVLLALSTSQLGGGVYPRT